MDISDLEYQQLVRLIYERLGISLGGNKRALMLNRLQPLIIQQGLGGFDEYYYYLKTDRSGQALINLANRITTNYSFFYREEEHFNFLSQQALPQRVDQSLSHKDSTIHLWSAGCSAGEEPYSLSMTLQGFFQTPFPQWDLGVLATDIDTHMLNEAQRGIYPEDRLKNVPPLIRMRYFKSVQPGLWQIKPEIKKPVHFSRFNLVRSQFFFKRKFFAIFCRNVMLYFDRQTINALVERFYHVTEDQGYLFIGLTESLDKNHCPYRYIAPSIYQKI